MSRIKRGGYYFYTWIGDHDHHVHVYNDNGFVVKWDLNRNHPLEGNANRKVIKIIEELQREGYL
jgi:hypothetical protein